MTADQNPPASHLPDAAVIEAEQQLMPLWDRVLRGLPVDAALLRQRSFDYFDRHPHPDPYFNILSGVAITAAQSAAFGRPLTLDYGISLALQWEANHPGQRLHKGTPYYFAGVRDILLGDLDRGFLWMHQALVEDQLSSGQDAPDTPALAFATMNAVKQDQAFRDEVARYAAFVEERLDQYRLSGRGALTLDQLRSRAMARPGLIEPLFQLVYVSARIIRLESLDAAIARDNPFAQLLTASLLSDLCLTTDGAVQVWTPGLWRPLQQAKEYAKASKLQLTQADLQDANKRFNAQFTPTLTALLSGSYATTAGRSLSDLEGDAVITYGVRNRTAHGVAAEPVLEQHFEDVEKRLFFQLFSVVERLLP